MGGRSYSVSVNYQSLLSNLFLLASPRLFFCVKYKRKRLFRVSFIELYNFMIYQHLNKRTKILPSATSHITHLCNKFNHVCTANFYATFLQHYFFIKIVLKLSYFCKKKQNSSTEGSGPRLLKQLPITDFWHRACVIELSSRSKYNTALDISKLRCAYWNSKIIITLPLN